MCIVCDRISMINNGTNKYFVKELETGYVVIGDKIAVIRSIGGSYDTRNCKK